MAIHTPTAGDVLLTELEANEEEARERDARGRRIVDLAPRGSAHFLMELVLEDADRERRCLAAIEQSLRATMNPDGPPAQMPPIEPDGDRRARLLGEVSRLLELQERRLDDLKALKHSVRWVASDMRSLYGEGQGAVEIERRPSTLRWLRFSPLSFVLDLMEDGTRRDIRILKYVKSQAQKSRGRDQSLGQRFAHLWWGDGE